MAGKFEHTMFFHSQQYNHNSHTAFKNQQTGASIKQQNKFPPRHSHPKELSLYSSVQLSSRWPICAPPYLSKISPMLPVKQLQSSTDWNGPFSSFQGWLLGHPPSIAFPHLPPNSARFSYTTEGVLFISAQLSTNTVSALQKVRVLNMTVEAT